MSGRRVVRRADADADLWESAARDSAARILRRYSTSFGLGTRLLGSPMREHIEAIYAMVRVADEVVDTYRGDDAAAVLQSYRDQVHRAMATGYSTDPVVHAFAVTAAQVGITRDQTDPFFDSMAMDLERTAHTPESFERYIHGSAAVVGEMCLAVFLSTPAGPRPLPADTAAGARALGRAYQKVNFLRDLAADHDALGRSYFPGVDVATLTNQTVAELVADCRADLIQAAACLQELPRRPRMAVRTTMDIYARLLRTIERTEAADLRRTRVRVSNPVKLWLAARNVVGLPRRSL